MEEVASLRETVTLDGSSASAALARRFLTDVLGRWRCHSLVEDAVLCVSEVVANAVVHAETPCELVVTWRAPRLRVEVHDDSPRSAIGPRTMSALAEREADTTTGDVSLAAMSGRGLFIVASLSEAVGEFVDGNGKIVWFELEERADRHGNAVGGAGYGSAGALAVIVQEGTSDEGGQRSQPLDGVLLAVPVALAMRSEDHVADVRRELKLVADDRLVGGLLSSLDALGGAFPYCDTGAEQVRVAAGVRRPTVDVRVPLSQAFADAVARVYELLTDADRLAAAGRLLARPASAEMHGFWRWSVEQVTGQLAGRRPVPFPAT